MRCIGALRLLGVAAVMAVALGGSSVDCEGTELHELVLKYDTDSSDTINSSELLNMSLDLGLPLTSDEADGVVTKYGSNSGELTDSQLCNYINSMLTDSTTTSSSSKSSKRGSKKVKPEDGGKDLFDNGKETYAPTPENLLKSPTKKPNHERKLKKVDTINFEETFNPTPENKKRQLKKVNTVNFVETFNPTPENKKRQLKSSKKPEDGGKDLFDNGKETYAPTPENLLKSPTKKPNHERKLKKVDTINFEETFNPTPENKKRQLKKVNTVNFVETFNPTPVKLHPTQKPNHERKLKSSKVDTINFEETFAPTPENRLRSPTKKPNHERKLKSSKKPEDGGKDLFDNGKETYAPTPENLLKSPTKKPNHERRELKTASLRGGLAEAADERSPSFRARVSMAIQALQALL